MEQQQERQRIDNQRRYIEEQERFKQEQMNQQAGGSASISWGHVGSDVSTVSMAASSQVETPEMKSKRDEIARKVMPLASNQQLRDLLQDLCDNGDMKTLDIIMKYV